MRGWHFGPVLRGIRGHRAAAVLVAVQFGIGLAITVLAVLTGDAFSRAKLTSPVVIEQELTVVELQLSGRSTDLVARHARALADVERTPGVIAATLVGRLPLHALEWHVDDLQLGDRAIRAHAFEGGAGLASASGLQLSAGRDFTARDLGSAVTAAIVSPAVARELPLGTRFDSRMHGPAVVVGIAEDTRTHVFSARELTVIYAKAQLASPSSIVLVRAEPGRGDELRAVLRDRLQQPGQHAIVTPVVDHMRHMASPVGKVLGVLATIVGTIVLVVLMGSMGLTYFLVASRTRETALRRAMGATRRDVIRYFLVENMILTAAGMLVGVVIMAIVLPTLFYELAGYEINKPLVALVAAAVVGLNLLATLVPARRAAAVLPVAASRAG